MGFKEEVGTRARRNGVEIKFYSHGASVPISQLWCAGCPLPNSRFKLQDVLKYLLPWIGKASGGASVHPHSQLALSGSGRTAVYFSSRHHINPHYRPVAKTWRTHTPMEHAAISSSSPASQESGKPAFWIKCGFSPLAINDRKADVDSLSMESTS